MQRIISWLPFTEIRLFERYVKKYISVITYFIEVCEIRKPAEKTDVYLYHKIFKYYHIFNKKYIIIFKIFSIKWNIRQNDGFRNIDLRSLDRNSCVCCFDLDWLQWRSKAVLYFIHNQINYEVIYKCLRKGCI